MPIPGIEQPELLPIDSTLRLRRYDGRRSFAYRWYQDVETVRLVDGVETPYTEEKLARMYRYLDAHGELYFIEQKGEDGFVPIGDVTLCPEDLPIVIGERTCHGQKVGRRVVAALVGRAQQLGWEAVSVQEIYDYNIGSRKCFESVGFVPCRKTGRGCGYRLEL